MDVGQAVKTEEFHREEARKLLEALNLSDMKDQIVQHEVKRTDGSTELYRAPLGEALTCSHFRGVLETMGVEMAPVVINKMIVAETPEPKKK